VLDVSLDEIAGSGKGREISRTRYLIAALVIERWEMKAKPLPELLGRWPEAISRWASRGAGMRMGSEDFGAAFERLDQTLAAGRKWAARIRKIVQSLGLALIPGRHDLLPLGLGGSSIRRLDLRLSGDLRALSHAIVLRAPRNTPVPGTI
jgi:hypothetical protein